MKTKFFSILYALVMILALSACSDSNVSDLLLDGNCDVTALKADNYDGIIDKSARTITVRVPEGYDVRNMKISALSLVMEPRVISRRATPSIFSLHRSCMSLTAMCILTGPSRHSTMRLR